MKKKHFLKAVQIAVISVVAFTMLGSSILYLF